MLESVFKQRFLERLKGRMRPHEIPLKIISTKPHHRSYPDTIILCGATWAGLEFKRSTTASKQPNQPYYIVLFDEMSYARFVNPDNAEEILDDLERLFTS